MNYRNFEVHVEDTAAEWRGQVETSESWDLRPDLGAFNSASKPFWVSSNKIVGVAKPGTTSIPVTQFPLAAHEKIAADLAEHLQLPVPPVILWDRGTVPTNEERYTCISAVPFANVNEWKSIQNDHDLGDEVRRRMEPVASAMSVFDTWVQNTDHNNHPGNLLVSLGLGDEAELHVAYIDYAYSLAYAWKGGGFKNDTCIPIYDPAISPNFAAMKGAVARIENMDVEAVREVVERIPENYLPEGHRDDIVEGLLDRKLRLRQIVASKYEEIS